MESTMRRSLTLVAGLWMAAATGDGAEPPRQVYNGSTTGLPTGNPTATRTATAERLATAPSPAEPLSALLSAPSTTALDRTVGMGNGCETIFSPIAKATCGAAGRFWATAEYLYWHAAGYNFPPLLTTSPPSTPQPLAGVLGAPGTFVVVGGSSFNDKFYSGLRFGAGLWLNQCQTCGI